MRKGEIALFTIPHELGYGVAGTELVPPNSSIKFVVELVSWITVVDVCKDGGIIKKIVEKGEQIGPPGDLDEVRVKYTAVLDDDTVVAKTPEEGLEFHVKDGHICPALPKAIKTMKKGEKVKLFIQPQYAFEDRKENRSDFSPPDMNSTLRIDLELLSFKPSIDVSGDLKVLKKILKEGEGSFTANEGASVTVRYTAMLEDGTVFERKGFDAGQPLEFVTDEEHVIPGLDRAAMTMRKGEIALLTIHPEFGFGSSEVQRDLAIVPPRSTINYEIEMLDFTREKAPWEMSDQERIEAATRKKEEGNLLFKNEKYQRARKKYDKAVDYVCEDGSFGDNDLKLVKSLRVVCWLNGAACSLKENDFQEAVKLCSKVLDIECSNVKALYRRAQAYMGTADLQLAELDVKRALETDPQNREMKQLQKNLKQLQAESNKRDSNLYSTMFSGKRKSTSPAIKEESCVDEEPSTKPVDYSEHFTGGGPFYSKKELVDWAKGVGAQFNMFLITARSRKGDRTRKALAQITCERANNGKHKVRNVDVESTWSSGMKTKKCDCPFALKCKEDGGGLWSLSVVRGFHNHDFGTDLPPHSVGGKLTEEEMQLVAALTKRDVRANKILEQVKRVFPNNRSSVTTIYNARQKLRIQDMSAGSIAEDGPIQNMKTEAGNEDDDMLNKYIQEISSLPPDVRRRLTEHLHTEKEKSSMQKVEGFSRDNSKKRDKSAVECNESIHISAPKIYRLLDSGSSCCKETASLKCSGTNVPQFFLPYVTKLLDVVKDGNCGYRAVAYFVYGDEEAWDRVRKDLFREFAGRRDLYAELFGGLDKVLSTLNSIMHWEGNAPDDKWMSMFDMGWVIATTYNVLCVSISRHRCVSYLPLIVPEGVQSISRTIAIAYLQEENHFMAINTVDDFPLPPILNGWYNHSDRSVFGWETRLTTRFNLWLMLFSLNGSNP